MRILTLLLLAPLATACAGDEAPPAAAQALPVSGATTTIVSALGSYAVRFQAQPNPIPLNQPFDLAIEVQALNPGAALPADLELQVDAAMPQHRHGMNRAALLEHPGTSSWVARGLLFHMSGDWTLMIDLTSAGLTERAQCTVHLD